MENIDEQLKISICSVLNPVSEDTVTGIIEAIKYAGLESLSDLEYVQEEDLILVLKPVQRRKLIKTWSERKEDNDKEKQTAKEEKIEPPSEMCPVSVSSVTSTLSIASITNPTAASFTTQSNHSNFEDCESKEDDDAKKQTVKDKKIDSKSEVYSATPIIPVSSVITTVPAALPHSTAIVHSDGSGDTKNLEEGEITVTPANKLSFMPLQQCKKAQSKWPKKKSIKLLEVYTKYKRAMDCAGVDELNVWNKIAVEVQGDSSKFYCDGLQCRKRIKELMREYEVIEVQNIMVREKAKLFDKAKVAFGTTDNLDNLSAQQPSTMKLKKCGKRNKDYRLSLLQVYGKYKNEFLLPGVEEHRVWEKISKEMREIFFYDCGEVLCHFDLLQTYQQYQTLKPTFAINGNLPYYFFQAQQVFETTHNQGVFPFTYINNGCYSYSYN